MIKTRADFNAVKWELKQLSAKLEEEGHRNYHNEARRLINEKYGVGWRENWRCVERVINKTEIMATEITQETKLKALLKVAARDKMSFGFTGDHTCIKCGKCNQEQKVLWRGREGVDNVHCVMCFCSLNKERLQRAASKIHKNQNVKNSKTVAAKKRHKKTPKRNK